MLKKYTKPLTVITGAAGMIGSGVVRHLNDLGNLDLLLVDDLKCGEKWKNLVGKQFVDVISRSCVFQWLEKRQDEVDAIIHLGACSDTMETNADYLLENNFRYSVRLAEWALRFNKRFIYASSAATYGDGSMGFSDDENSLEHLRPLNMYGFSKHLVDLWMKREKVLDRVVALKYFNVFGPNEYHKGRMSSFMLKMAHRAYLGNEISLFKSNDPKNYKDGEQCRDFIYLKDAVKMTCAFLQPAYRSTCGIFNIGQGQVSTWNQVAQALFDASNQPCKIAYVDMPKDLHLQYQNYTCADMGKFHKILSSREVQLMPMEQAVQEYVSQYVLRNARW